MTTTGTAAPRTPASVRRLANGAGRFAVEVCLSSGWTFISSRTTERAAIAAMIASANAPQHGHSGMPLRVRDRIDGDTVAACNR